MLAKISPSKVLVVDDHPIIIEGLVSYLSRQPDLTVCATASSFNEAMAALKEHKPDVAVVDICLPDRSGLEICVSAAFERMPTRFLAMSFIDEADIAHRVAQARGKTKLMGYLMKEASLAEIGSAVRTVLRGEAYISNRVLDRALCPGTNGAAGQPVSINRLSARELEVFIGIGFGKTSKEIAADLSIASKTVDTHKHRIREKLALDDANQLHVHAYKFIRGGNDSAGPVGSPS